MPEEKKFRVEWERGDPGCPRLPLQISRIHIDIIPDLVSAHWAAPEARWVPYLTPEHLQSVIGAKERLLPNYARRAPECWLLLASARYPLSRYVKVAEEARDQVYISNFDQIWVLLHMENEVFQLATRRPAA